MELIAYAAGERTPFVSWYESLNNRAADRVAQALDKMRKGIASGLKSVGGGVFEYRVDFGPGYRIYIGRDGDYVLILLGGRVQATPTARHHRGQTALATPQAMETEGGLIMSGSRDFFEETVHPRLRNSAEFRQVWLLERVENLRTGDAATAKSMLTHYAAAIGFDEAADAAGADPDALRRTLDPDGDAPDADVLAVIKALREREEASALAVPAGAQP